jgi:hypothetical protein
LTGDADASREAATDSSPGRKPWVQDNPRQTAPAGAAEVFLMPSAQIMPGTHPLDYAKAPPWRRRTSVRRAIAAGVLALILLAALKFARPAWDHARLLHYQGRCLKHVLPPDRVVLDQTNQHRFVSPDWDRFYELFSPPGKFYQATVFAHEMHRPGSDSRLVVVDVAPTALIGPPPAFQCDIKVIQPGGLWSRPKLLRDYSLTPKATTPRPVSPQPRFRIYAGQPDATNPAHFTIDYQCDGKSGTIDGWLQSDDTILLEPRPWFIRKSGPQ